MEKAPQARERNAQCGKARRVLALNFKNGVQNFA
jgi:hypothetical protein